MTNDERTLLFTVARIMRAWARETAGSEHDDVGAIDEAMLPFDPRPDEPINETPHNPIEGNYLSRVTE